MARIAIITARGGSKRIPGKNIRSFHGKPILAYSIETALESKLFDEVMVSTDDKQIAEIALKYGAKVPFLRSEKNSDDFAGTADVIAEVLNEYKKAALSFEYACCIYPTAPLLSSSTLYKAFQLLTVKNYDTVFPVCSFSFPIQRALKITESKVEMMWPENAMRRSQDLEPAYHDAGQFYWINTESFLNHNKLYTNNSGSIILDEMMVQDIDNENDWKLAELKHTLLNQKI